MERDAARYLTLSGVGVGYFVRSWPLASSGKITWQDAVLGSLLPMVVWFVICAFLRIPPRRSAAIFVALSLALFGGGALFHHMHQ